MSKISTKYRLINKILIIISCCYIWVVACDYTTIAVASTTVTEAATANYNLTSINSTTIRNGSAGINSHNSHSTTTATMIKRKLAFPDFRDEEKAGTITLLGSASIDRDSGVINIPAIEDDVDHEAGRADDVGAAGAAGRALYSFPFRMIDAETNGTSSFETTFSFQIRKRPSSEADINTTSSLADHNVNNYSHSRSDSGLTFMVVPDEKTVGRRGGWLGLLNDACDDSYRPFAVEFDTFKNEEFQDPNDHHVGINYGSIVSRFTADISSAGLSLLEDQTPTRAWISYDASSHLLNVHLAKDGSPKPSSPILSAPLDLSPLFKEYMFVGFSASSSSPSSHVHSILSWHFSSSTPSTLHYPKERTCLSTLLPTTSATSPPPSTRRKPPGAFIIFCLVVLTIALALINLACVPSRNSGSTSHDLPVNIKKLMPRAPLHKPRKFSLYEILDATRMFHESEILGYGTHGMFYKGNFHSSSSQVAIKRFSNINVEDQINSIDVTKVQKEITRLSQLYHPNLVPLKGWCLDKGEILLLYEYMPNGSLDQWLLSEGTFVFPWIRRYKIVKEIANALAHLHSSSDKPIVHKNVKLSNILLDVTFRAKLGDFGILEKVTNCSNEVKHNKKKRRNKLWFPGRLTFTSCASMTFDGQKIDDTKITKEVDIYCYGVLLFEIVSGKEHQSMVEGDHEARNLVGWVWSLHEEGKLVDAIDENLRSGTGRYSSWKQEAICVLNIGLLCTREDPFQRPSMIMVVKYLQGECSLPNVSLRRSISSVVLTPNHSLDCREKILSTEI